MELTTALFNKDAVMSKIYIYNYIFVFIATAHS